MRSQNETLTLFVRAARAAGFPFGAAEEIGRAGLFLARQGLDGVSAVLAVLDPPPQAGGEKKIPPPKIVDGAAEFDGAMLGLCGAAAMEFLAARVARRVLLRGVAAPWLAVGFAGAAAENYGLAAELRFANGVEISVAAGGIRGEGAPGAGDVSVAAVLAAAGAAGGAVAAPAAGAVVGGAAADWRRLEKIAAAFFVPAGVGGIADAGAAADGDSN